MFRFQNAAIKGFENNMKMALAKNRVLKQKMRGRCGGVLVTCDAYCRVLSIEVEDKARYSNETDGTVTDPQALCLAVRGAVWDATTKLQHLKHAEYKRLHGNFASHTPDGNVDSLMLRPNAYEAFTADDVSDRLPTWMNAARETEALSRAICVKQDHFVMAIMAMEDESRCVEVQRQIMAKEEQAFWHRVDLIRKAQKNTIRGPKRVHSDFNYAAKNREDPNDNVQVQHVK
eukprot:PhM_4_TR8637/c0_g1_i1/m.67917